MRTSTIRRWAAVAMLTGTAALGAVPTLRAQDQPAVLIHGLFNQNAWNVAATNLQQAVRVRPYVPHVDWRDRWSDQAAAVAAFGPFGIDTLIVGGYSNGGPVGREFNRVYDRNNRIVTVAGANSGAPLATNLLNGSLAQYGAFVVTSLVQPIDYYMDYYTEDELIGLMGLTNWLYEQMVEIWIKDLAIKVLAFGFGTIAGQIFPVTHDLAPGSAALAALNGSANLSREAQAMRARVGIVATAPSNENQMFYVLAGSEAAGLAHARAEVAAIYLDLFSFFSNMDPETYPELHAGAPLWLNGSLRLAGMDLAWCNFIGAGTAEGCTANDGLLPVETQQYPGSTNQLNISGNHIEAISGAAGLNALRMVFANDFNVPPRQTTDPTSLVLAPGSASFAQGTWQGFTATVRNAWGQTLSNAPVTWASLNPGIASLTPNGQSATVQGVAMGSTLIIASANGYADTSAVTITTPNPPLTIDGLFGQSPTSAYNMDGFSVSVSGGRAPYTYAWAINWAWQPNSNESGFWWTNQGVNYNVMVLVTDADGQQLSADMTVQVLPPCTEEWCQ